MVTRITIQNSADIAFSALYMGEDIIRYPLFFSTKARAFSIGVGEKPYFFCNL